MTKNFSKLSEKSINFHCPELPDSLFDKVMSRIDQEKRLMIVKRKLTFLALSFLLAITACLPVLKLLWQEMNQSGFAQYLLLLFSDFGSIRNYWQDFILTLLETMPAASLAFTLLVWLVILWLLRLIFNYIDVFKKISNHNLQKI
jgi:ABC-type multidrug transport system fused ATPase/permease subunit